MQYKDFYSVSVAAILGNIEFKCNMCGNIHWLNKNSVSGKANDCLDKLLDVVKRNLDEAGKGAKWSALSVHCHLLAVEIENVMKIIDRAVSGEETSEKYDGITITWAKRTYVDLPKIKW